MGSGSIIFLSGIAAVAAYAIITGYDYYKRIAFRFAGVQVDELSLDNGMALKITLGLQIYNPTPVTLTCNSISGYVYVNGYLVGVINVDQLQKVYAKGVSTVYTSVVADGTRLGAVSIANLINKIELEDWLLGINASIDINGISIPVNFQESIKTIIDE